MRMIALVVASTLLCLTTACEGFAGFGDDLATEEGAIIGGTTTQGWPAVGVYLMGGGGLCTGTLVQPGFVLTAAHCAVSAGPDDLFMVGYDLWNQWAGNEYYTVASAHIHPDYTGDSYNFHDIAVLVLDDPIEDVEWIPVNTESFDFTWEDRWFHYVGFGSDTVYGGAGAGVKRETDLQMYDYYLELFFTWTAHTNTCSGDSGGPALVDLDGYWYVAGVNSLVYAGSNEDDSCSGGAISTRVDHELDFLAEYFDPYETPYPDPEPEGDDDDGDDDVAEDDDEGDGCECAVGEGSGPAAVVPLLVLATFLGLRRGR